MIYFDDIYALFYYTVFFFKENHPLYCFFFGTLSHWICSAWSNIVWLKKKWNQKHIRAYTITKTTRKKNTRGKLICCVGKTDSRPINYFYFGFNIFSFIVYAFDAVPKNMKEKCFIGAHTTHKGTGTGDIFVCFKITTIFIKNN